MVNSLIIGSKEGHQVCLTSRECAGLCCTLLTSAGSIFSHSSSSGWWYLSLCSASNFSKKNIWLHKKCLSSFKRPHLLHFTSIFCASFAVMSPCSSASSLVNNFRIRSSNSQQLEQVHRSSMSLEKRVWQKRKKFCNCHSLICDAHGEQIALINPTTFSPAPVAVDDTEGKLKAWRLNFLLSSWLRCFYLNWKDDFSSSHKQILRSFDCCLVFIFMLSKYLVESDLQTREKRSSVQL